ncbi:Zn-dependent hydrolase [Ancylobacter amanitiformis]|uniref:N-carbamoyl-L-amino-acid hydrolase n=1 Tax=Ancylobacter amanitiformis TaxID=217069 RepID=A0ABU0LUY8_9HYPH|nr:Zn-dependent hydrolase [Ancylobacter amanitiformis]MDQ0512493.1 N-carbamoyl-L-amino-acid hydrolase [Ancylobacter amanitiformis]
MAAPSGNWRTDGTRLWDSLMRMAQIGPGLRGGNNRQTLTDADGEGRLLFQHWCEAAGLTVGIDAMGTMFARREGTDPDALPVLIGSHLDTQPTGGRFDGVLGVLGALEVVRTLNDLGIRTRHPVEVVNWTNEEGARFPPAMVASAVYAGVMSLEAAYATRDSEGKTLGAELERIGFKGEEPAGARKAHAYFELHIEQGPILEAEGLDIGVVTHGQGTRWLEVTLTGREAHTGSTPMPRRLNAGLGAARIIELVDEVAWKYAPLAVGTVGQIDVHPNSRNIIAGRAVFTIDIRHPELAVLEWMAAEIRAGAAAIAERMGLGIAIAEVNAFDPVTFDPVLVGRVRAAAEALGYAHRDMVSGAGHDACWVNKVAPAAMIFCPCVDGLSHNEDEAITPEWAKAGADVLLHAVLETAQIA